MTIAVFSDPSEAEAHSSVTTARASRLTLSSFFILFTLLRNAFRLTKPRSLLEV